MSTTPVYIRPYRALVLSNSSIVADAVVEEHHEDDSQITTHPVEQGSVISDHKYAQPARLTLTYGWSLSTLDGQTRRAQDFLQQIYQQLRNLKDQVPTQLLDIYTGKRHYTNMTIKSLTQTTDKDHENIMSIQVVCQEFLFATTQVVQFAGVTADDIAATAAQQTAAGTAPTAVQKTQQTQQTAACHVQNRGTVQTTPVSGVTAPTLAELQATD